MGVEVSREDLDRFVCWSLPYYEDGTETDVAAIIDDVVEAWPSLIGQHPGAPDRDANVDDEFAVPDNKLDQWIYDYICTTDSALKRNRCTRSEDVYWDIVGDHQITSIEMSADELADATQTEIELWELLMQTRITVFPDGTVHADITPTDSALRARCVELTREADTRWPSGSWPLQIDR
jgi:hypothetical protein